MNFKVILVLLFCFHENYATQTNKISNEYYDSNIKNQAIRNLKRYLKEENWRNDDQLCVQQLLKTITNFQNGSLWASFILDSIQPPSAVLYGTHHHLGNFDECIGLQWKDDQIPSFQYCLATIQLRKGNPAKKSSKLNPYDTVEMYLNTQNGFGRDLNEIKWGICLPSICEPHTVAKVMEYIYQENSIMMMILQSKPNVTLESCQGSVDKVKLSTGAYLFMSLCASLFALSIFCTYFLSDETKQELQFTKAFCMKQNTYELIKPCADDIKVLHGMRALTSFIIVVIHEYYTHLYTNVFSNTLDIDNSLINGPLWITLHINIIVDTFYLMSGLLLVKSLGNKQENPVIFMFKRYIRLIGTLAFIIFYLCTISINTGNGPLWTTIQGIEQTKCLQNWWINLLMLNNYVNYETMCYSITWYIASDYQMTFIGIFLFYFHQKRKKIGKLLFTGLLIISVLLPGFSTYFYSLKAITIYDYWSIINIAEKFLYFKTQYRIGSYLVGLAAGYVITRWKPNDHQLNISKTCSTLSFVIFYLSFILVIITGPIIALREYNALHSALYAGSNRVLFAFIVSTVLLCEYGFWPIVYRFLSWSAWVPLSRLSYGLYLVHQFLIIRHAGVLRAPIHGDYFDMLRNSCGDIVIGLILSLVIWLLVQAPLNNLTNILLQRFSASSHKLGDTSKKSTINNGVNNKANVKSD